MKILKKTDKKQNINIIKTNLSKVEQCIVFAYLFCMLGVFPLHYKEQYYKIGDAKFDFFWNSSLVFIGISLMSVLMKLIIERILQSTFYEKNVIHKKQAAIERVNGKKEEGENIVFKFLDTLSSMDYVVLIYGICVILSYGFSDFKDYALKGAPGWKMGLCSQMIFIAVYFILSRQNMLKDVFFARPKNYAVHSRSRQNAGTIQRNVILAILAIHLISSALTFIFGILHRFEIDPLGMYEGLDLYQKIEFLSTIGQATWFSSYVCTVFAIGVTLFYISEQRGLKIVTGIYSVISFGILVTQNSDSAFIAIAGIMLLLGYFSLSDIKKWYRFWQIMSLMWGTFAGIGILQKVFAYRAIPLDTLSIFFSQGAITWLMFLFSFIIMLFCSNYYKKKLEEKNKKENFNSYNKVENEDKIMSIAKSIYKGILFLLVAAVVLTIIFIYLNTKGYLLQWFGYQNTHQYLLFDRHWGSNRGSTWMICWQAFMEMPFYQKLFGVGPDSVSAYLYSVPKISDLLHNLWGSTRLTNAHNEYLNSLLCYGIVGLSAWLAVLIGGIRYFYNKAKENPFMIAFALCIMGYACHNIFCYQQVCATPFLFLALGIGESLTKSENFNTIK